MVKLNKYILYINNTKSVVVFLRKCVINCIVIISDLVIVQFPGVKGIGGQSNSDACVFEPLLRLPDPWERGRWL